MRKTLQLGKRFLDNLCGYYKQGWNAGLMLPYLKASAILFKNSLSRYYQSIYKIRAYPQHAHDEKMQKLHRTALGLHTLLPSDSSYSYTILILVNKPKIGFFETSLNSALKQTAPHFEILIGYQGEPSKEIKEIVQKAKKAYPKCIIEHQYAKENSHIELLNQLVKESSNNYLLFLGQEDWIRPDFLYRFEQLLHL